MLFNHSYLGSSRVTQSARGTGLNFVPDAKRDAVYFSGELADSLVYREGMSALHDVVVSDLRFKPKDKTAYLEWVEQQNFVDMQVVAGAEQAVQQELESKSAEFLKYDQQYKQQMAPFFKAQRKYFSYLWRKDMDAWYVLDPVITVHPDQLFFECFSEDESSYGCFAVKHEAFKNVGEMALGTTNIDYSAGLYKEFQKIRTYKSTRFEIEPGGFQVEVEHEAAFKESKIDVPDSWVRGFLQVSSAMSLEAVTLRLDPVDIQNICFVLRRNKEILGPRSMRYCLKPGEPIEIVFDPWGIKIKCRSIYQGKEKREIRVWGRRRLHTLERLIPMAKSFTVKLLGSGMPSFYTADMGSSSFTLGLSGWTANDWSRSGNFDLMASRGTVDEMTSQRVFNELKKVRFSRAESLAHALGLETKLVKAALVIFIQAGRVVYDLANDVYRSRELTQEPLPMHQLSFANEREEQASQFLARGAVKLDVLGHDRGETQMTGSVQDKKTEHVNLKLDKDEALITAQCSCNWHFMNQLRKGPCQHILALRAKAKERSI